MTVGSFFQDRQVLITGITGFKGRWLAAWLDRLGARVCGFGLEPEGESAQAAWSQLCDSFSWSYLDVRDAEAVDRFVKSHEPEVVLHLAAQPLVRLSYREPVETFSTNVLGTVHVLEAVRTTKSVRAVVNVTSDKCYENRESLQAFQEDDPMGGSDPYSVSKGCSELITTAWRKSFLAESGISLASARAGNVIGGGDWSADRIVPDIARGVLADEEIDIRHPQAVRPWQHVLEPLSGYLMLAERLVEDGPEFAEGWNFGPDDPAAVTVGELARRLVEAFGRGSLRMAPQTAAGLHEATNLSLDSSKAWERLNWRGVLTADQRIDWTVDWYREAAKDSQAMRSLMISQIEEYTEGIRSCPRTRESWFAESPDSSARPLHAA